MRKDDVLKYNRIIANFMGRTVVTENEFTDLLYGNEPLPDVWILESLKYHESWDWLMTVVEKIEEIALEEDEISKVHRFRVDLNYAHCTITDTYADVIIADVDGFKLTSTFMAVSEFCEWWFDSGTIEL